MRLTSLARHLLAFGLAGLGVLSLRYDDFALNWQPVPDGLPLRHLLAYVSGALLLLGGLGLLVLRLRARAAVVSTIFIASWLILLQVPRVAASPQELGVWLGFGETLLWVTGLWMLAITLAAPGGGTFTSPAAQKWVRILCGAALLLIGPSHFKYADFTAGMIPAWIPSRLTFAYLTGAGHIAAGLGLFLGLLPRLAATMEAAMIGCFVLLLHLPGVLAAPTDRMQWTMFCVAIAYDGAAWAIAGSLAAQPWFPVPGKPKPAPAPTTA